MRRLLQIATVYGTKNASFVSLDKRKSKRNEISNFRPVSILNIFSKIYKLAIKNKTVIGTEKHLSPPASAYIKGFITQHGIT